MALVLNGSNNTIGGLAVGGVPDGTIDADALADGAETASKRGSGSVLQIVSVNSGTTTTCSNTTAVDVSGLSVSITCSHANNKVLAMMTIGGIWTASDNDAATIILTKDTTELCEHRNLGIGQSASLNQSAMLLNVTTAGDTNAHTYKGQFKNRQSGDVKVNQVTPIDSTLVLMEIAA